MVRMNLKMLLLSLALGSTQALAQGSDAAAAGSPGCGDADSKFDVKNSVGKHSFQPAAGNALVYFIEDDSNYNAIPKLTTRAGLDGAWSGATHGNSFFTFEVKPGVHHLCARWQGSGSMAAATSFKAETGGVYYFVAKNTNIGQDRSPNLIKIDLDRVDSDQGQLLVDDRPLSLSKPK